jgi:hypothetical protein
MMLAKIAIACLPKHECPGILGRRTGCPFALLALEGDSRPRELNPHVRPSEQPWQPRDIDRDPQRLVLREDLGLPRLIRG